ncbi:MAG: efflux RND transporter permease subunit [Propionibacteriaceae bacterium]|jgi:HAE1 family hydrophobic/amphiphilic exporter-1|nr:efflux RND transporter permease subunit [Propionibacteriaceae bacterium]
MTRLTRISLARRTVVALLSLLVIAVGVFSMLSINQEMLPEINFPKGTVIAALQGASPEVVEAQVTKPLETAVTGVAGVNSVTSKSSSGMAQISVSWDYGLDPDQMAEALGSAVDAVPLPSGVSPTVISGGLDDTPVIGLAVSSNDSLEALSAKVEAIAVPALKTIPGVRDVGLAGGERHEVVITYSPQKLEDYGIDPTAIASQFSATAKVVASGVIRTGFQNLDVQTGQSFASVDDIAEMLLQGTDGPVALGEVATVEEQPVDSTSISRVNGKSVLTLAVTKTTGANTVSTAKAVRGQLDDLARQLGNGATFAVSFDQSPLITESINGLSVEGGIGLCMAVLVIFVFLGSLRPTIITAISIPLSLLIALAGLWAGGFTLNVLTLGALTVAIGRVVDDSIVVIENIKRHLSHGPTGAGPVLGAVKEVAGAVTSSTMTTAAVFVPIAFVSGLPGQLFRPFALTIVIALLGSLLVSLTVVPVLASWLIRRKSQQPAPAEVSPSPVGTPEIPAAPGTGEAEQPTLLQRAYLPVLDWSLAHRWLTLGIAAGLLVGTVLLVPFLKTDLLSDMGTGGFNITQKLPAGTSLEQADEAARKIEALLDAEPDILTYQTTVGSSSGSLLGGASSAGSNQASFTVTLSEDADLASAQESVRAKLADAGSDLGEVEVSTNAGTTNQVAVYVESADGADLTDANARVMEVLRGTAGLAKVASNLTDSQELLWVDVDEQLAAEKGMNQTTIGQAVARATQGQMIGALTAGEDSLSVYLRSQSPATTVEELSELRLPVTAVMNAAAREAASDKVSARSDKISAQNQETAKENYQDQLATLKKNRNAAKKSSAALAKQAKKAKAELAKLQAALDAALAAPVGDDKVATQTVLHLTQAVAAMSSQVAQLAGAAASSSASVGALDKQLEAAMEARQKSLDSQSVQEELSQAGKDAAKTTAKPIKLSSVAEVKTVAAPAVITRVEGVRASTISAIYEGDNLSGSTVEI